MLAARMIWSSETADDIGANALQVLAKISSRNQIFFNGKAPRCLLGGLFYILGYRFSQVVTQKEIANILGITEVSIRQSYKRWLRAFPEQFTDVTGKMTGLNKNLDQNHVLKKFNKVLLQSVDEAFSSLGENVKTSIYFHLEHTFLISRQDIPFRIADFSDALERLLGLGARHLELLIMKMLHEKVDCQYKWEGPKWLLPEITFRKYVDLARFSYEDTGKIGKIEAIIDEERLQKQIDL